MHKYCVRTLGLEQMNKNCTVALPPPPPPPLSLSLFPTPALHSHKVVDHIS